MRILHLTTDLPYPPASGGAIRVHGMLEGLRHAGHDVTIMCFHDGNVDGVPDQINIEVVPHMRRSIWDRLRMLLFTRQPDIAGRFHSDTFSEKLRSLLEKNTFEWVQFEGIEMACYMPLVKQIQPSAKLCFDTFNAEYALQHVIYNIDRRNIRRWHAAAYSYIQVGRIKRFERAMCQLADAVVAVSPEDADLLRDFRADRRVTVVPNGVWVDDYAECAQQIDLAEPALVFTGKMDYRPNVDAMLWFADAIFPLVLCQIPTAQLYIVGQQPHPRLDRLRGMKYIHVTGWVDSVLPYLHGATVYVAPLRMGSGTRLKLLGAMAAGCAIIGTSIASAGLLSEAKQGMVIEDTEAKIAAAIARLLQNPQERQELGKIARNRVRQHYDWSNIIPRPIEVYTFTDIDN